MHIDLLNDLIDDVELWWILWVVIQEGATAKDF